jgi:molybdate transport system substrate-binding protein
MTRRFIRSVALVCSAAVLSAAYSVDAAELKVLATGAHIDSFKEIVPQFERASGHKLIVKYDATPALIKNIEAGEAFDVAVIINGPLNDGPRLRSARSPSQRGLDVVE